MHFSVPVGNALAIGRIRPYKIGGPADVEEAWSLYHCSAPLLGGPREESMGLADRLGRLCPLSITAASMHTACLKALGLPGGLWAGRRPAPRPRVLHHTLP